MQVLGREGGQIDVRLSAAEAAAVCSALNEALEQLEDTEFETRMGVSPAEVRSLLGSFRDAIDRPRSGAQAPGGPDNRTHTISWPPGYDESAWEVEAKGWLRGVEIHGNGRTLRPTFYAPERLQQDVAEELATGEVAVLASVLVVKRLDRDAMEAAVEALARSGRLFHPLSDE